MGQPMRQQSGTTGDAGLTVLSISGVLPGRARFSDFLEPVPADGDRPDRIHDFDPVERLGRKGIKILDRVTCLALAACGEALTQAGLPAPESSTDRFGVVSATTNASLKSVTGYSRATLVEARPYLVNAMLFPNTVMNCAAGQAAIRFGLRGPNATIAGADLAGIQALHYARNLARRDYLDHVMVFGAEEMTDEYRALHAHSRASAARAIEGGVAAVLTTRPDAAGARLVSSAVVTRMAARGESSRDAVMRCLRAAGADDVDLAVSVAPLERDAASALEATVPAVLDLTERADFLRSGQGLLGLGVAAAMLASREGPRRIALVGQGNGDQFGAVLVEGTEEP